MMERGARRRKHARTKETEAIMAVHELSIYFVKASVSSCDFSTGGSVNPVSNSRLQVYSDELD